DQPWPDVVLEQSANFLRQFGDSDLSPWVHFAVARAHAAKIALSLPPNEGHLTAAEEQSARKAAITEFRRFIRDLPDAKEAVFAWQEAWRLMAGLPPSFLNFGCGCE